MALTQIKTTAIADDAVTTDKLANAINTERTANTAKVSLENDSVTGAKIADDAVGAEHIEVLDANLEFADDVKVQFGAGDDLEIYHSSNGSSYIKELGSGNLYIYSANLRIMNAPDGSEAYIEANSNGAVELYYDNSKKIETLSGGAQVTGSLGLNTAPNRHLHLHDTSANTQVLLQVSNATTGTANGDGFHIGINSSQEALIQNKEDTNLTIYTGGETSIKCVNDGAVELYYDNSKKLETTTNGAKVTGELHILDGSESTNKLTIGDNDDFDIWHETSGTFIRNHEGYLAIQNADDNINTVYIRGRAGEDGVRVIGDGAVELYYDNSKKLATDSTGIWVSGALRGESVDLADSKKILLGSGDDLEIYHDGSNSYIKDSGTGSLVALTNHFKVESADGSEKILQGTENGSVELFYDGSKAFETISGGIQLNGRNFELGSVSATGSSTGIRHNTWNNNEIGISMSHQSTGGQTFFTFYNPNGIVGYIQSSGSGTIYSTSSDYRLKENEVAISDGITRLKQLKPYRFNFKKDPTKTVDGFFAHEAQTVVPEAVTGTKDEVATKDEGERKIGDPIMQGIDQSKFVPLLTAALQEAITKIETLETEVAALKG